MSAEKVTEDLAQVSLEGDVEPQTADGAEAIYTSEIRGSDESGKLLTTLPVIFQHFILFLN